MRIYATSEFCFRPGRHGLAVSLQGSKAEIVHIVPDGKYPGMWRVRLPDGGLTVMVNLARAKDAALHHAAAIMGARDGQRNGTGAGRSEKPQPAGPYAETRPSAAPVLAEAL